MSLLSQFNYPDIIGSKIESIYTVENVMGQTMLILNLGENILTMNVAKGQRFINIEMMTEDAFIREYEEVECDRYYPYLCFEGKVIKNVQLLNMEPGEECMDILFGGDDKRMRIAFDYSETPVLDLDIVRPGFTINFGNKSIEEVEALLFDKAVETSSYVEMTKEVRAVYYYYSCLSNVFEIAGYIYEIFRKSPKTIEIDRPKAYQLARKLIA